MAAYVFPSQLSGFLSPLRDGYRKIAAISPESKSFWSMLEASPTGLHCLDIIIVIVDLFLIFDIFFNYRSQARDLFRKMCAIGKHCIQT
mmetsp:Transcript_2094/g.4874  ORF Transcript_2094/g.4874 Transcript_2094/m.4874 type:complete len:89 (+) Transcript_2094:177-443(+)